MSRKKHKKRNEQQKRLQVTDASGWTRIIRGSRGQNHQSHISLHANEKLTEAPKDLTMDKVLEKFNKYCQKWKESTCFNDFQLILENDILASEQVNVTQCVCLGLGSLTSEDGRDASMYELAFLFTTLETLGKKHNIDEIYFQDPIFNHLDKEVIKSLDYTVVENPEAFEKISNTAFLFAPHLEAHLDAMALDAAHPSLCIGNDLELCGGIYSGAPEWMTSTQKTFSRYMDTTISKPMPHFDRDPWPCFMRIYWPRPSNAATTEEAQALPQTDTEGGGELVEKGERLELEKQEPGNGHV